jgi:predicted nucleotidyltransferase
MGLAVAGQACELLKREFNAAKVVLFGSMVVPEKIHERSDVDLAVWGLNSRDYYRAVGRLLALNPDIAVDLVEAEFASPQLLKEIETTGVTL